MALALDGHYLDEMIAHAREEAPNECCGMLGGKNDRVLKLYRARNEAPEERRPYSYQLHRQDLIHIISDVRENDWEVVGVYHSHTGTDAYPSPTDVNIAMQTWPDIYYLIVSLAEPERPVLRAFRILDEQITEEELVIS